jgi:GNAT superfamily N-acetyltransferase
MAEWVIEPLAAHHERGEFSCGKAPLDKFIRELADRYERQDVGRTYVAVRPGENRVIGYHTLATGGISLKDLPKKHARRLPHHDVLPAVLLGRLAVDDSMHRRGLGADLLLHALKLAVEIGEKVAVYAVEVQAIDDEARNFYHRYGFLPLDQDRHLFLSLQMVRELFQSRNEQPDKN